MTGSLDYSVGRKCSSKSMSCHGGMGMATATGKRKSKKGIPTKKKQTKKYPSEKEIQSRILAFLKRKKVLHVRVNSGFIYAKGYMIRLAPVGFPDIIAFRSGITTGIEVKKKGRVIDPPQLDWCHSLRTQGMDYIVVYSTDQVKEWLLTA